MASQLWIVKQCLKQYLKTLNYNKTRRHSDNGYLSPEAFELKNIASCWGSDLENLPVPDLLAEEIIENMEAGLGSFRQMLAPLNA